MARSSWPWRRFATVLVVLTLAFGTTAFRPATTKAGFGSSPGPPMTAHACDSGKHFPYPRTT
ncbi:MAG TPA: hypothetical protein VH482_16025 [Thermomicrobiales bacterium]|jgi:hypothetical protein